MDLQRVGMKFFFDKGGEIPLVDFIPVLHRWVQQGASDMLLIDVADYSHVIDGPGILLAGHEGNFSIDERSGKRGLAYYQKTDQEGDFAARLELVCLRTLRACRALEAEADLAGRVVFAGASFELFSNDRLLAPHGAETYAALEPPALALAEKLFGDSGAQLQREANPRERAGLLVQNAKGADVASLLARLEG